MNDKNINKDFYSLPEKFTGQLFKIAKPNIFLTVEDTFMLIRGFSFLSPGELDKINATKNLLDKQIYLKWYLDYLAEWDIEILFHEKIHTVVTKKIYLMPCLGTVDEQFFVR